jgi:hypothetical protein
MTPYLESAALQTICLAILEVSLDGGEAAQGISYPLKIFVPRLSMILALIPQRAIHVAAMRLHRCQKKYLRNNRRPYPAEPAPTINTSTLECPGAIVRDPLDDTFSGADVEMWVEIIGKLRNNGGKCSLCK